jgi:hypothetical protein
MALNGDDLGDALMAAVTAAGVAGRQALFRAMGHTIVDYIKANAVVTVTTSTPAAMAGPSTLPGTGAGTVA